MDALAELKEKAQRAREFTYQAGECEFTLRTPTRTEVREVTHAHGLLTGQNDAMVLPLLQTYLLQRGLVAWTGVRLRDLIPDAGTEPVGWSADTVQMLIDAQPELADKMGAALLARTQLRAEAIEADAKN
jgi:hypothetical protein